MHVRTEFSGSGENSSDVFVTANVLLTFPKRCEGVLTISDVVLRDEAMSETPVDEANENAEYYDDRYDVSAETPIHPKSREFAIAISMNSLRFVFTLKNQYGILLIFRNAQILFSWWCH